MTDIVVVAAIAAIPGILSALLGILNRNKLGNVETKVDGRLSELLELTRKSSHAEGMKEEKEHME